MKIVRLDGNTVREVIPEYALPVEKFYGAAFAAQCVEAPDYVDQRWVRNKDGSWTDPATIPDPIPEPSELETRVTELEDALAQTDEAAIELYEAQALQEEINAAQDEALIELYEMMEV